MDSHCHRASPGRLPTSRLAERRNPENQDVSKTAGDVPLYTLSLFVERPRAILAPLRKIWGQVLYDAFRPNPVRSGRKQRSAMGCAMQFSLASFYYSQSTHVARLGAYRMARGPLDRTFDRTHARITEHHSRC